MGKEPISVGPEGAPPTNGDDERPTSDPSADAHRMLSVGGTQLKKDAVFGQDASPKKPPMPALGIEGKGYSGVDGERLGSPSARPSSQQRANGGSRLKTPPAHTPTPPAGAPSSIGFHRYSRSPSGSGRLHSPTAAQYTNGGGSPAIVSNVVLTLESPPTTSRRPNGSPLSPHRKPLGDRKKGVSKDREQQRNPHQEVATLAAQPLPELPDSVQRGGEEEIAWLRQQLQKAHQEAHAIHSAMVAQRHNQSLGEFYDTPDAADTPEPSPQLLRGHGTITSLLPPDQDAPSPTGTSRRRADRKRAPGAIVEQEERNGDELEGSELAQGQAPDTFAKSDELTKRILAALAMKPPFEGHEESDLMQVVAAMAPVQMEAGVDVLREGDHGDLAYWVESGTLDVVVGDKKVDTIEADTVFGEVALVYGLTRTATIRANTKCSMWMLHRSAFQHILRDKAIAERKARFAFLRSIKIFSSLSGREISRIVDVIEPVIFEADSIIIQEGEEANSMYIIQQGQAVVSQKVEQAENAQGGDEAEESKSLLRILKSGDFFGERALLVDGQRRSATVTATSKVRVLCLDKASFVELLGSLREEMIKRAPKDRKDNQATPLTHASLPVGDKPSGGSFSPARATASEASFGNPRSLREFAPHPANLKIMKKLGSGGYGRVALAHDHKSRRVYALKRVCKDHLLAKNPLIRCEWLLREKDVLASLEHPFIVKLHGTYADEKNLFLLLSPAMGGDLYRLIEKLGQVPERVARFYISSIVLALAHIHSLEVVYRDLKPENVLLDAQGFVKICDFGFAKKVTDRTYTRCGTPDYTAPEMLLNQGVNQACDWWALGILIFEMLIGDPPFTDPDGNDMKTYENITNGSLSTRFPDNSNATDEARALIQSLCTVKVAFRLGYLKGGANDIIDHAWFQEFDWDGLANQTKEPPWKPRLESYDDTRCFEDTSGDDSLDGQEGKSHPDEVASKWSEVQHSYAGGVTLQQMTHLISI